MQWLRTSIVLTLLFLIGCADENPELDQNYPETLINTWVESYEEDYGIYRPFSVKKFPTSRFRRTYTFMKDNECAYLVLSPVDAHSMESGKWEYSQKDSTVKIYKANNELTHELKIIFLASDMLTIAL